jgi:hypothetical protein
MQSSSVFYPFSQKIFSRPYAIPLSVPLVCSDSLFPSICNPRQCSTHLARKSFPVNIQSPSVFHSFGQIVFSRQYAIPSVFHWFGQIVFSRQYAVPLSVPPVWSYSLFLSICSPRQCSFLILLSRHWYRMSLRIEMLGMDLDIEVIFPVIFAF